MEPPRPLPQGSAGYRLSEASLLMRVADAFALLEIVPLIMVQLAVLVGVCFGEFVWVRWEGLAPLGFILSPIGVLVHITEMLVELRMP